MVGRRRGGKLPAASDVQRQVCRRFGATPLPPMPATMVGIALSRSRQVVPLNAERHLPVGQTNGWFVWRGTDLPQDDNDFFAPIHVEHLSEHAPELAPYLALPPGWRVLLAPGYEDVWFDPAMLEP